MDNSTTVRQYGVRYPNGSEDWNTAASWGTIDSPHLRESFQEQYRIRMESFGMPPMKVQFFQRDITTLIENLQEVDDTVPEDEPEVPVDEVPVEEVPVEEVPVEEVPVEETLPAAPDEPVTPPTNEAPAEEELPEDADGQEVVDPEPSVPDNEGEPTDGTVK